MSYKNCKVVQFWNYTVGITSVLWTSRFLLCNEKVTVSLTHLGSDLTVKGWKKGSQEG